MAPSASASLAALLPEGIRERLRAARAAWRDARDWEAYRRAPVVPPPHAVKVRAVIDCARRHGIEVLVETGTFEGEMARKCRDAFREIHTIELDPGLAERAARRLGPWPWIHVHAGDSADLLPRLLERLPEPVLFWLDGHYSGAGTAHGAEETPLPREIETIAARRLGGDAVLVDDARLLGTGAYPTAGAIRARLEAAHSNYVLTLEADMLRWEPISREGNAR
ncbi:MAG TPA: hypothetical protein VLT84_02470 [Acidobacteriota bacterium]|nr:hypothetical protein [Acidobacteriota bacterium]